MFKITPKRTVPIVSMVMSIGALIAVACVAAVAINEYQPYLPADAPPKRTVHSKPEATAPTAERQGPSASIPDSQRMAPWVERRLIEILDTMPGVTAEKLNHLERAAEMYARGELP